MQPVLFRITLPCDCEMGSALRQLAERVAQCAGYGATESARIATSVGQTADAVMAGLSKASQLDVTFERDTRHLNVWLRYPVASAARGPAAVDAALSSEALRQGMDSVEFGSEDGIAFCCLRRPLPEHPVTPDL